MKCGKCGELVKSVKNIVLLAALAVFCATASSAAVSLDQNEEMQSVIGNLSALKTAAQMYYGDSGNNDRVPPLPSVLSYFDEGSLPPDALSLYAIDGRGGNWYVGYNAYGLMNETYMQLEDNAQSLNLVGDDLASPWRRGSAYIWSSALALRGSGGLVLRESRGSAADVATVLVGAAVFIDAIKRSRSHSHYSYPRQPWHWRSSLRYHPSYRDRFYKHFARPPRLPGIHRRPAFSHREPPRVRREPPRYGSRRPQDRRQPERNRAEYRRPGGNRQHRGNRRDGGERQENNRRPRQGRRPGRRR